MSLQKYGISSEIIQMEFVENQAFEIVEFGQKSNWFVDTASTEKILEEIRLGISCRLPILLQGPAGCGKTLLIQEACYRVTGQELLKIHLGDQTDSKILLGTYTTPSPGVFKWQPGVLTTAVQQGRWIVIEDIDLAPDEVLAVLVPLLETNQLHIASRGERIGTHDNFRIFSTKRLEKNIIGLGLWHKIVVEDPSLSEIKSIISQRFPTVHQSIPLFYQFLKSLEKTRTYSLTDLIKWCKRIKDSDNIEFIFQQGYDCFLAMIPDKNYRNKCAFQFGEFIGLPSSRVDFYLESYVPVVALDGNTAIIGNTRLEILKLQDTKSFANTAPSLRLLERIATGVKMIEPLLLVGETGTGKTTVIQHLASILGKKLVVINMSQQSDSSDILGGFKPIDAQSLVLPVKNVFDELFAKTFSLKSNQNFIDSIQKAYLKRKWGHLLSGFSNAFKMASAVYEKQSSKSQKKRKLIDHSLWVEWENFAISCSNLAVTIEQVKSNFLFSFVEGTLVNALKNGDWILFDEINLATAETLECLAGLVQNSDGSVMLLERGDTETIKRHAEFRMFACMNPANDQGKKDLPISLRTRFTEIWVDSPDENLNDLLLIIKTYIGAVLPPGPPGDVICEDVAKFYKEVKELSKSQLFDGADQKIHISMRTLARALQCTFRSASIFPVRRALYEGCYMTFLTFLNTESFAKVYQLLETYILNTVKAPRAYIEQIPSKQQDQSSTSDILVDCFWLKRGPLEPVIDEKFILTDSVFTNLKNLSRAIFYRNYPILIQGPTSAGKTSMIEYLAKKTGHRFIRINNHEHTDIQEYIGGYQSNEQGQLEFQEGVLVQALRNGHWVVLDELNLAPSDILEALNRLLDDNRELFIPETQQLVKPHPSFMLFATQNPAGQYGGRKQLSRAFRNRFLELHFKDIPQAELSTILEKRCLIPPSYAKKLTNVYSNLQNARAYNRIFDGRNGLVTLRDLFRWSLRKASSYQELAEDGFMLIAERSRNIKEVELVQSIIEKELKVKLDMPKYYETEFLKYQIHDDSIVWTGQMKRLFVQCMKCIEYDEPVLLIGETGCGKTTVVQAISRYLSKKLHIINVHQNSETSDFIGGLRPCRSRDQVMKELESKCKELDPEFNGDVKQFVKTNKDPELQKIYVKSKALFEWYDGTLVQALRNGDFFLLDEISLADDSVLERLNSVLEPQKSLVLVENNGQELRGTKEFQFFATMNPGGDYGKKELSPALRNRFTEIWVPSVRDHQDLILVMSHHIPLKEAEKILEFLDWFSKQLSKPLESLFSLRDILAWVEFIVKCGSYLHGGLILIDGLGVNPLFGTHFPENFSETCSLKLQSLACATIQPLVTSLNSNSFQIGEFSLSFGNCEPKDNVFSFNAPTTCKNAYKVIRAMQLKKPILLQGSPGVGKTSLITSIANISRHELVRINLSEQTDLMDLFGSDLPVEGGAGGEFCWRDGPFLQAMKNGLWVLLDELNLASQQVLEGLNACLDHRATVYIPELDKHFNCHKDFRVFACQNPQKEGGGRKGLPKSFVNRFTQVYVDSLHREDLSLICNALYPDIEVEKMLNFNENIRVQIQEKMAFGFSGSPWEFNLRDVLRWCNLVSSNNLNTNCFFNMLYCLRMRTETDRQMMRKLYEKEFGPIGDIRPVSFRVDEYLKVGNAQIKRKEIAKRHINVDSIQILPSWLPLIEALIHCVHSNTLALLVGPAGSGKSSLVRYFAALAGERLVEFALNPGIDSLELLGGFEQVDLKRSTENLVSKMEDLYENILRKLIYQDISVAQEIARNWEEMDKNSFKSIEQFLQILQQYGDAQSLISQFKNLQLLSKGGVEGQFEWIDSTLINALENGYWIVLDNVNLCSASVLDRLNSLVEVGGNLALNERGLVDGQIKIITPHPNFRMFMTMDPQHGEISRAMRNRAVELFVPDLEALPSVLSLNKLRMGKSKMELAKIQTGKIHFENVSMPTIWPDRLPNLPTEPTFFHLVVDGSLLLHSCMDESLQYFTSSESIPRNNLVDASFELFLETANPKNYLIFLTYVYKRCIDNLKPLLKRYIDAFNALDMEAVRSSGNIGLQLRKQIFLDKRKTTYEETRTMEKKSMSFAHQVFAHRMHRLPIDQLAHPSLALFYELFDHYDNQEGGHDLVIAMEQMWDAMLNNDLSSMMIAAKTILNSSPSDKIYQIAQSLQVERIESLEDMFQVMVLCHYPHFQLAETFRSIDAKLDPFKSLVVDWFSVTFESKKMLVEAMATLYCLEDSRDELLLSILETLPEKLELKPRKYNLLIDFENVTEEYSRILNWPILDLFCIQIIPQFLTNVSVDKERLYKFLMEMIEKSSFSPLHFEPLFRLYWFLDSSTDASIIDSILVEAQIRWHQMRWNNATLIDIDFFKDCLPFVLQERKIEYQSSDFKITSYLNLKNPIYSSSAKLKSLQDLLKHFSKRTNTYNPRLSMFKMTLKMFCKNLGLSDNLLSTIHSIIDQNELTSVPSFISQLNDTITKKCISEIFGEVDISIKMIYLGLLMINHLVPEFAWDPASFKQAEIHNILNQIDTLKAQRLVKCEYQYLHSGIIPKTADLDQQIESLQIEVKKLQKKVPVRPQISEIDTVYRDLYSIKNHIVSYERVVKLLNYRNSDEIQSFIHVLDSVILKLEKFSMYQDLLLPIQLALYQLKDGLDGMLHLKQSQNLICNLVNFYQIPEIHKLEEFYAEIRKLPTLNNQNIRLKLSLDLALLKKLCSPNIKRDIAKEFSTHVFAGIVDLWKVSNDLKELKEQEENSLYRHFETDEEYEEMLRKEMFPDFENEFIEEEGSKTKLDSKDLDVFDPDTTFRVYMAFQKVINGRGQWSEVYQDCFQCASAFEEQYKVTHKCTSGAQAGYLFILNQTITNAHQPNRNEHYNFYNDSNVYEAMKIKSVLIQFDSLLSKCLNEWPEHQVLNELKIICRRIANFAVDVPIMKLLTGLELLLTKAQDWEQYSSKEFSLASALESITKQIVLWRKLELDSWKSLLNLQDLKFEKASSKLWFHLWQLIYSIIYYSEQSLSLDELLVELVKMLNDLFLESFLGEFEHRLNLVCTLHLMISDIQQPVACQVSNILFNFHSFYHEFKELTDSKLLALRKPILKELTDYVRIATWKDVNVYALRASARKTHVQLSKFVKKYRQSLEVKFKTLLVSWSENAPISTSTSSFEKVATICKNYKEFLTPPIVDTVFSFTPRLSQIKKLTEKSYKLVEEICKDEALVSICSQLNDSCTEIIDTISEFQKSKEIKGQKVIRKKRWVDLLKYLESIGLETRSSLKYARVQDSLIVNSVPKIDISCIGFSTEEMMEKANRYYNLSLFRLSSTRQLAACLSIDISRLEFEKSMSFLDHLVHLLMDQRECLSNHKIWLLKDIIYSLENAEEVTPTKRCRELEADISNLNLAIEQCQLACSAINIPAIESSKLDFPKMIQLEGVMIVPKTYQIAVDSFENFKSNLRAKLESLKTSDHWFLVKNLLPLCTRKFHENETLESDPRFKESLELFVERLLKIIQVFNASQTYNNDERLVTQIHEVNLNYFKHSSLDALMEQYRELVGMIGSNTEYLNALKSTLPLLKQCSSLLCRRMFEFLMYHKTLSKLTMIIANTFYGVFKNGFCIPQEENSEEEQGEENVSGMGIGEGEGEKDVSHEIEDNEQVEGLEGEQSAEPKNVEKQENAIEMDDDFDGVIEDVSDEGEDDDGAQSENDNDPLEQMGDLDDDLASVVDEKLWDGEDQTDGKTEKDAPVENSTMESQIGSNEEEKDTSSKEKQKPNPAKDTVGEDNEDENTVNQEEYEDAHGIQSEIPDEEDLENKSNASNEKDEHEAFSDKAADDDLMEDVAPLENDSAHHENKDNIDETESLADSSNEELPNDISLDSTTMEEIDDDELNEAEQEPEITPMETEQQDQEGENTDNKLPEDPIIEDPIDLEEENGSKEENTNTNTVQNQNVFGVEDGEQKEAGNLEDQSTQQGQGASQDSSSENMMDDPTQAPGSGQASSEKQKQKREANPLRSLAEATDNWLNKIKNIGDAEKDRPKMDDQGDEVEFIQQDFEDQGNQQALGVALKDQLNDMNKVAENKDEDANFDEDDMEIEPRQDSQDSLQESKVEKSRDFGPLEKSLKVQDGEENTEENEVLPESADVEMKENEKDLEPFKGLNDQKESPDQKDLELDDVDIEALRKELEQKIMLWRQTRNDSEEPKVLWQQYSRMTQELAFNLCEQLRLVLEPTLATKLKGDYKTGKRLNMRKIIPYVASQFKKDKIWLKRTKPFKRTYQVMIAIDDSKSMASPECVQMTLESLALITKAMVQLEVGDISIVSFGENVSILQPFEQVFSDESGANIIQSLKFDQEITNVKLLIDNCIEYFRINRKNDTVSLSIIISDGKCQDHETIKSRVRSALEDNILMVFIIIDTRPFKHSIFNMASVSYKTENNQSVLVMNKYMDTFPFDYFVLVQKIEELPIVLCETLRQFFAYCSNQ